MAGSNDRKPIQVASLFLLGVVFFERDLTPV
jgi:hypothetical protein